MQRRPSRLFANNSNRFISYRLPTQFSVYFLAKHAPYASGTGRIRSGDKISGWRGHKHQCRVTYVDVHLARHQGGISIASEFDESEERPDENQGAGYVDHKHDGHPAYPVVESIHLLSCHGWVPRQAAVEDGRDRDKHGEDDLGGEVCKNNGFTEVLRIGHPYRFSTICPGGHIYIWL